MMNWFGSLVNIGRRMRVRLFL